MEGTVLTSILDVFTAVGEWFATFVPTLYALFWTPAAEGSGGSLTFLGVLSVSALAVSVVLLFVSIIQNFLHFRS